MAVDAGCFDDSVLQRALRITADLAAVQPDERVTLVPDDTSDPDAVAVVAAAFETRAGSVSRVGPDALHRMWGRDEAAVIVSLAAPLLTHTCALRRRLADGARYVNLRGVDLDLLERARDVDFDAQAELTQSLAEALSDVSSVRITDEAGTDLTIDLDGHTLPLSGLAPQPGTIGGFPGGEVAIVPIEGSLRGVIRRPAFIEVFRGDATDCEIRVMAGIIQSLAGGDASRFLSNRIGGRAAGRTVGEFGPGTNRAFPPKSPRMAKKSLGTAHIGIGDNRTFGGRIDAETHIDVVLTRPTVVTQRAVIIADGELVWSP